MSRYIVTVFLIALLGFTATIWIRPDVDVLVVFTIVSAFALQAINIIKTNEAGAAADEAKKVAVQTHLAVNSRLDAFIKNASLAARAEGKQEGRDSANARTDELAAQKVIQP